MKKILSIAILMTISSLLYAETDPVASETLTKIRKGTTEKKHRIEDLYVANDATVVGDLAVTGTSTVAGKGSVSSTSATALKVEKGTKAATGATVTNSFSSSFASAPVVIYRYTTAGIAATNPVTVTVSNFIVEAAQTNLEYIAVGQ
jgi:hypothetical protein